MQQRRMFVMSAALILAATWACQKSAPFAPTAPTVATVTPADNVTLKVSAPTLRSPVGDTRLDTFTPPTLSANAASPTNGAGVTYQYHFQLLNPNGTVLDQFTLAGTNWTPTAQLAFDTRYTWQVRAEADGAAGPWSAAGSFISPNGGFIRGNAVFDPLTNGKTVAHRIGGHFITGANGGWMSDSMVDGLDYDIDTCDSCKVEFDASNFGNGEGVSAQVDVKWFSMGDRGSMDGGFIPFRNSPWKMHLEQRSDGDGSGMQLIWRNGAADDDTDGDPEYGDHRGKFLFGGPDWGHSFDNKVWHFVIEWTRTTYKISIGENGGTPRQWFPGPGGDSGFFGGNHPYSPPGHRIELGCVPRGESMVGVIYRNFKVTPQ
ncbi:MAG TPA: hypothetical protein VL243_04425 [Vicinamibacterales bacterium]|nr:hypothetical protein [Vicinamibacterales bacterium]